MSVHAMKRSVAKKQKPERIPFRGYHIVYYAVLTLMVLMVIVPFVWMVMMSFEKMKGYSMPYPPRLLPKTWTLFNYEMAIGNVPILKYLGNTVIVVTISALLNVFIATLSGFVFSKGQFKFKNLLFLLMLSSMMIPLETKLMPMYDVVKGMGLSNSFLGIVLPNAMTCSMYIFFIKQFCDDLPTALFEAGTIDGAGKFRIYAQIYLPLMGPVVATIIVLDVINVWNDLLWPMIVIADNAKSTIQLGLVRYNSGSSGQVHAGISTALSVLSIIPLSIVFCFMQKYIVASVAATGVKQ